jgi:hypothetical protein
MIGIKSELQVRVPVVRSANGFDSRLQVRREAKKNECLAKSY